MLLVALVTLVAVADASAAAPPCTYASGTYSYDLTAMIKSTGNYGGSDESYTYKANVCASTNNLQGCSDYGYNACQFASGAAVASLGTYDSTAQWSLIPDESGTSGVQYSLTNGDICWIAGRQQIRTAIYRFRCSPGVTEDTFFVDEDQTTCTFTFTFRSPLACPSTEIATPCKWKDSVTNMRWDISPLQMSWLTFNDYWNYLAPNNYSLNVCQNSNQGLNGCGAGNWSICQFSFRNEFIAGLASFVTGPVGQWTLLGPDPSKGAKIVFTNGEPCNISGKKMTRKTIVEFHCEPSGARKFVTSVDSDSCTYTFLFFVAEGCPYRG